MKLSVYIPAHNEEANLDACLKTVAFADEVIVLLDRCTDRSKEIALQHGAKIIEGAWPIESERRMAAMNACSGDWILDVDADERIPVELAHEIREVVTTSPFDLHLVPFDNYIGNRLVKYGWGAYIGVSMRAALFRRGAKTYETGNLVHPQVTIKGRYGPALHHAITHHMDRDLSDTLRRFDSYTTAHAKELIAENNQEGFWRNFARIFSRFYKCYIRRHGYREGAIGFFIAMLGGLYPMLSYIKAKYKI